MADVMPFVMAIDHGPAPSRAALLLLDLILA